MATKIDELKALMAVAEPRPWTTVYQIAGEENVELANSAVNTLPALIAAVEAAQEVYKEWDADCEPWPPDYQRLGEALKPFGE